MVCRVKKKQIEKIIILQCYHILVTLDTKILIVLESILKNSVNVKAELFLETPKNTQH